MAKYKKGDFVKVKPNHEDEDSQYERIWQSVDEQYKDKLFLVITGVDSYDEYGYEVWADTDGSPTKIDSVYEGNFDDDDLVAHRKRRAKQAKKNKNLIDTIVLDPEKKDEVFAALSQIEHSDLIFDDWGFDEVFEKGTAIALLFYGRPGTGKTLMAEAIAQKLERELKIIQTAEVQSSEPGGAERAIKEYFKAADENEQVLLFDECDSLIYHRDAVGAIMAAQVNALLSALETYEGVVIFTTNRLGKLDPAFERRVSAKIEFPFPRENVRERIWKRMIPKKAPLAKEVDFAKLAKFPIAGGNIKNVVLNAARLAAHRKLKEINVDCFHDAMKKELEGLEGFKQASDLMAKNSYRVGEGELNRDDTTGGLSVNRSQVMDQKKGEAV